MQNSRFYLSSLMRFIVNAAVRNPTTLATSSLFIWSQRRGGVSFLLRKFSQFPPADKRQDSNTWYCVSTPRYRMEFLKARSSHAKACHPPTYAHNRLFINAPSCLKTNKQKSQTSLSSPDPGLSQFPSSDTSAFKRLRQEPVCACCPPLSLCPHHHPRGSAGFGTMTQNEKPPFSWSQCHTTAEDKQERCYVCISLTGFALCE